MTVAVIFNRTTKSAMKCPHCGSRRNGRTDTRPVKNRTLIRRRHVCGDCRGRWTTYEAPVAQRSKEGVSYADNLYDRWLTVHDIRGMGERAVKETA